MTRRRHGVLCGWRHDGGRRAPRIDSAAPGPCRPVTARGSGALPENSSGGYPPRLGLKLERVSAGTGAWRCGRCENSRPRMAGTGRLAAVVVSPPLPWRESRPPPPSRPLASEGRFDHRPFVPTIDTCRYIPAVRRGTRGLRHPRGGATEWRGWRRGRAAGPAQGARWGPWRGHGAPAAAPDDVDDHRGDDDRQQDAAAVSVTRDQPPDQPGHRTRRRCRAGSSARSSSDRGPAAPGGRGRRRPGRSAPRTSR